MPRSQSSGNASAEQARDSASSRVRRIHDNVMRLGERLQRLATESDQRLFYRAEPVSSWSVADHLKHLAKANQAMAGAIHGILDSGADDSGGGPTLVGRAVLLTGWIPRGVGKAPENTRPQTGSSEDLRRSLEELQQAVAALATRLGEIEGSRGRTKHFAFGGLTPFQWVRVMEIHTRHHLKIVGAIQRAAGSPW
jgi:hypothetical protein